MDTIKIIPHQATWFVEFAEIAAGIRSEVGASATRIDHIGSTAVEGLAAKDVIDVQISVTRLADTEVIPRLQDLGYQLVPNLQDSLVGVNKDSEQLQKIFLRQPKGYRSVNVHIREEGRINQRYPLVFRDYLRADDTVRNAYQALKVELAQRFPNDADAYYAIKDPYMDTVYQAAQLWAQSNQWQPDDKFC